MIQYVVIIAYNIEMSNECDMSELNLYNKSRHSTTKMVVHLIFTTKYRKNLLDGKMIRQIGDAFKTASERLGCTILEVDGEADHVHVLVEYPPKLSISVLVNNLKSISSRHVRKMNIHLKCESVNAGRLWSRSYFAASAGGVTIETLKEYVQKQKTPN